MKRSIRRFLLLGVAAGLIPACTTDSDDPLAATGPISVSPTSLSFSATTGGANPASQSVQLSNLGNSLFTLFWTASSNRTWLQCTPSTGTTGSETDTIAVSAVLSQTEAWTTDTPSLNAPAGREEHSMVWTGEEMIVWGGTVGVGPVTTNTGTRYDPHTGTWSGGTSTVGAATSRWGHSAVWTGTEMIVWGGADGSGPIASGYKYNPATDTWSGPISTVSAPAARRSFSAVWTGTEMIVWGGADAVGQIDTGGRYNPTTDTWIALPTVGAPTARWSHTAAWTGTEMIVWGGWDNSNPLNTGGKYNPTTNTWVGATATAGAPSTRLAHSAIWDGSEVIVFGGQTGSGGSALNTGGRYNPVTDSWTATTTTSAAAARWSHEAVWTGTEMIVWGGAPGLLSSGKHYRPPIALTAGTYTGTFMITDPAAANSPKNINVTFTVGP